MELTDIENSYSDSLSFLYSQLPMFSRVGAAAYKPGLDTSIKLDNFFGNPHTKFKSIHIAGTNGKGSCSHTIAAMLQAQGYKTGLYTSPHLVDFRERIRINGKMIPKENVIKFVEQWRKSGYDGHPSFFELTMIMAFNWFAEEQVDFAVIEVGMGGRLDSTNIITPEACIITNISPDHMQFLGNTLPEIANEKAGIIKSNVPVVIGEADPEIREVFLERAKEVGAPIRFASEEMPLLSAVEAAKGGWDCSAKFIDPLHKECPCDFHVELSGDYQLKNANTILTAVDMLRNVGIEISMDSEIKGFAHVEEMNGLAGRWMKLSSDPLTICDTGHNEAGIRYNMGQLQRLLDSKPSTAKLRMVMGFVNDKDVAHIINLLPRQRVEYYITKASVPRAMPEDKLLEYFMECGIPARTFTNVAQAYAQAKKECKSDDIIYVGGSTFIVADLLANQ